MKKLHVGVIYGGRSGEHEVSLASAAAIIANLDRQRYEPVPLYIEKDGRWTIPDRLPTTVSAAEVIGRAHSETRPTRAGREAHFLARPSGEPVLTIERDPRQSNADRETVYVTGLGLDVVFPILHGPYGEDGTVQGLLELANVPYVGAGVLASSVGMDKALMKAVFAARGLPIVDHVVVRRIDWESDREATASALIGRLGLPVFVKPANLGSSVGVTKVKAEADLNAALELAAQFDRKMVVEAAVPGARELECGVLGNDHPEGSIVGEVIPRREFYDYDAKYLDENSEVRVPAELPEGVAERVRALAVEAFLAVDGAGMARVDFLLARESGRLFLNEINTIPGFTTISMYARLWNASGLPYPALIDRLIALALERHAEKQRLRTTLT